MNPGLLILLGTFTVHCGSRNLQIFRKALFSRIASHFVAILVEVMPPERIIITRSWQHFGVAQNAEGHGLV